MLRWMLGGFRAKPKQQDYAVTVGDTGKDNNAPAVGKTKQNVHDSARGEASTIMHASASES